MSLFKNPVRATTTSLAAMLAVVGLLLAAGSPPAAAAGAGDMGQLEITVADIGKDVNHGFLVNLTDQHPELDITQVASTVQGDDVVFTMTLRGTAEADNASVFYRWTVALSDPDESGLSFEDIVVEFSNGSATYQQNGDPVNITVVSASSHGISVSFPFSLVEDFAGVWRLGGAAQWSGDGIWMDTASLVVGNGAFLYDSDASGDVSPYSSPTATISSVTVLGEGSHFRVVVEGTTSGTVSSVQVALGDHTEFGGMGTWQWHGWWVEENQSHFDANATLQKKGGSWASWNFTWDFDPAVYSTGLVDMTKIEARAYGTDGSWGHGNASCACGTATGPIPSEGGNGDGNNTGGDTNGTGQGSSFVPAFGAPAALGAAGVAVLLVAVVSARSRRR